LKVATSIVILEFITSVAILPALRSKGFKGINQVRVWAGHTCDPAQKSQQLPIEAGDELLVRIPLESEVLLFDVINAIQ
jgi:hypothetical protein